MASTGDDLAVGFVGLGIIAETHLAVLAGIPRARLAFVADSDPRATATFRDETPPRYERLDAALAHHQPDLVVIATPTHTHADLARVALGGSDARVLVEKPLVHDIDALDALRSREPAIDVASRLFVAHHFAFSPEVRWAANLLAARPEWGPVTRIAVVFHDAYIVDAAHSFAAYGSSWVDSGVNQLSMLTRFVDLADRGPVHESGGGASSWCTVTFRSGRPGGTTDTALLRASWEAVASSKHTTLYLDESGTEVWLDNTATTAVASATARSSTSSPTTGTRPAGSPTTGRCTRACSPTSPIPSSPSPPRTASCASSTALPHESRRARGSCLAGRSTGVARSGGGGYSTVSVASMLAWPGTSQ